MTTGSEASEGFFEVGEYVLIQDDDGHWFVCPAERKEEALKMLEAIIEYWNKGEYEHDAPPEPDFIEEVGGSPSLVRFTGYRIE